MVRKTSGTVTQIRGEGGASGSGGFGTGGGVRVQASTDGGGWLDDTFIIQLYKEG